MAANAALAVTLAAISATTAIAFNISRIMQHPEKSLHPRVKPETGQPPPHSGWRWVSERGLRVETGDTTLARYVALISRNLPEIDDIIPADGSLLLILRRGAAASADLHAALVAPITGAALATGTLHQIAVEYGGATGPDLLTLAEQAGMDAPAYIDSHAATEYTVAFLGFQPGFPYLRGLPRALHAPRRASPRVRVAAGSVAIGGAYSGIYPSSGPGGWQIIGRTASVLFDPQREAPALLMPGDRVRFVPS
jgi:KipI family sensor histidine kinase inhibitor